MDDDLGPVPEGEGSVEHLPARQLGAQTQHPHPLPEVARPCGLRLRGLEQGTAALLALIDEERKHHQVAVPQPTRPSHRNRAMSWKLW